MKLKPVTRTYKLREEEITIYPPKPIEAIQLGEQVESVDKFTDKTKKAQRQIEIFSQAIFNYTSLKEDNTAEDIANALEMYEMSNLVSEILQTDQLKKA